MPTYYVSSGSGLSSNNGASASTPFATLQQAADVTQPGDKVEVLAGTYSADAATGYVLAVSRSGTAAAPITYEGYNGARPVISLPNGGVSAVQINASYINFNGFELVGNAQSVSLAQAQSLAAQPGSGSNRTINNTGITVSWNGNPTIVNHVSIQNNVVHDFGANGISAEQSDYITVQGNTVYDNGKYGPYGTSGVSLFGSHDSDGVTTGYKNFIVDNTIYGNQQLVGSYAIGNSSITDGEGVLIDSNSNFETDGVQYKGSTLVANNVAYNNGGVGLGAYASSNVDFIGNTAYGNDPSGTFGGQIGSSKLNGGLFENNTVVAGPGGIGIGIDSSNTGVTEGNNVISGGDASATVAAAGSSATDGAALGSSLIGPATLASDPTPAFVTTAALTADAGDPAAVTSFADASGGAAGGNAQPSMSASDFLEPTNTSAGAMLPSVDPSLGAGDTVSGSPNDIFPLPSTTGTVAPMRVS
jgi:parallel beta-helix repeat protein